MEEITRPPVSDFFQPNFWPNTPDILHKTLQEGGRPAFMHRVILAATLAASYGIYGPAYELAENAPAQPPPGKTESEEYLDSEKYQIRQRDRNATGSLVPLITALNRIRRENQRVAIEYARFIFIPSTIPTDLLLKVDAWLRQYNSGRGQHRLL